MLALLALAGCESDEDQLARLRREAAFARADVARFQLQLEESPENAVLRDSLRAADNRRMIAERDLNRFLR